jgi:uncharacterized membrane protein
MADQPEQPQRPNYWQEFRSQVNERLEEPCRHPTFIFYFFGIIVVIGGFGLLEPMFTHWVLGKMTGEEFSKALVSAAYTYFIAIAATAAVDLILADRQRKYLLMFMVVASILVILCALFAATFSTVNGKPEHAIAPVVLGYLLSLMLWWVGNAKNAHLLDTPPPPTAATGGDPHTKPSGDLSGFSS